MLPPARRSLWYSGEVRRLQNPLAIACLLLTLGCFASLAAKEPKQFVFLPNPEFDGAAMLNGSTWVSTGPDFRIELQRIGEQDRRDFIEKVTNSATDPFASPPGERPGYLTFIMRLENQGAGELVMRSQQCWLITDHNEYLYPISMEGLRGRYGVVGREPGAAYERSVSAVFPTTLLLNPGESRAGLLVYRAFKPKTRRFRLDIQLITASGEVSRITAPYRRRRVKPDRSDQP